MGLKPLCIARAKKLAHINAVGFREMTKRLFGPLLVENVLAGIANIAAAIRGGEVGFLLTSSNRLKDLRHFNRGRLVGLQNLANLLVISVCDTRQFFSKIMDATEGSAIRVFLDAIFSGNLSRKLLAFIEGLHDGICGFSLLHRERSSFGSIQQVCDVIVSIRDLSAILDPRMETRNRHFARPLVAND
jgi:hypothetical protein